MSTRGNTQAFANAATGEMTINGQPVSPVKSDVFRPGSDNHPDGNADDPWRVQWSFATTVPMQGQSMLVTFEITLAYPVADHEGGPGQPVILPAGPLFQNPFRCTVTGTRFKIRRSPRRRRGLGGKGSNLSTSDPEQSPLS